MSCENCEESAYVIDKLAKLLSEIAVIVNGVEPHDTSWSYHDLPEKVRALKQAPPASAVPATGSYFAGLDYTGRPIYRQAEQAQQPAAAVPAEADAEALDFARNAARLLHGFMLDTNAIGAREAGVNLARSIKEALKADAAIKSMGETL